MPPSFYEQALQPGGSGYFSEPSEGLDPSLFDGMHLRRDVRIWLLHTLEAGLKRYLDLNGVRDWLHAWLAGSGITYQWSANRGNGDLDVLFGVDMGSFAYYNPEYHGVPERDVADHADAVLKQKLWPKTAHVTFGQQEYEVTFFWAAGTGQGIEHIHPYAAYDLKTDAWVVTPPALPHDPSALYPSDWYQAAKRDSESAGHLSARYHALTKRLSSTTLGETSRRNSSNELTHVHSSALALFDEIHQGRTAAFGEQGRGYGDWHNFRWQAAKQSGAVAALKAITDAAREAREAHDRDIYGGPIDAADTILTRDILRYGRGQ
jgi:hypothetical protein